MAKVLGIGGVFLKSPNPHKLCQWYSEWLGLTVALQGMSFVLFFPGSMPRNAYTV
jgi:hypothetical protein